MKMKFILAEIYNGYKLKCKIINSVICILIFVYILQVVKYELFFLYRDKKQRELSKKYLNEAISLYSTAISIGPTQDEVEKIESDRDLDLITPADLYRARGNMFSWDKKWNQACSDWKVSKKYGDKDARDNYREFKC